MARASLELSDELNEAVESQLGYGDSKSEFIRQALRFRLHVDPILDEIYERHQRDERLQLVEKAVREKVDKVKADGGRT